MRGPRHPQCTPAHQAGALLLVAVTFLLTRLLSAPPPPPPFPTPGPRLSAAADHLRVYVYAEDEVDGLRALLRGRDGAVSAATCLKGQWGTQVKIHQLLLRSRYRTLDKDEANLFFVTSYVKCVRMTGALTDKEINQTYVKVLSQMPYFHRSEVHMSVVENMASFSARITAPIEGLILGLSAQCFPGRHRWGAQDPVEVDAAQPDGPQHGASPTATVFHVSNKVDADNPHVTYLWSDRSDLLLQQRLRCWYTFMFRREVHEKK